MTTCISNEVLGVIPISSSEVCDKLIRDFNILNDDFRSHHASRALSYLKQVGLYFSNTSNIPVFDTVSASNLESSLHGVIYSLLQRKVLRYLGLEDVSFPLSKSVWIDAIYLTVFRYGFEEYLSEPLQWKKCVHDDYTSLFIFVHLFGAIEYLMSKKGRDSWKEQMSIIDTLCQENASLTEKCIKTDSLISENRKKEEELLSLRKQVDSLLESRVTEESNEVRFLKRQVKDLSLQLEKLQSLVETLPPEEEEEKQLDNAEEKVLLPLPEEGVVFCGGRSNLIAKLSKRFPKWDFISADASLTTIKWPDADLVFVFTSYCSHKFWYKMKASIGNTPLLYLNTTNNIDLLEKQMQERYTEFMQKS